MVAGNNCPYRKLSYLQLAHALYDRCWSSTVVCSFSGLPLAQDVLVGFRSTPSPQIVLQKWERVNEHEYIHTRRVGFTTVQSDQTTFDYGGGWLAPLPLVNLISSCLLLETVYPFLLYTTAT